MAVPGKVQIPRLDRANDPHKESPHRATKACSICRARKIRCSGEWPTCKNCRDQTSECVYFDGRKDKLRTATDNNKQLVELLQDLSVRVDTADKDRIGHLLHDIGEDSLSTAPSDSLSLSAPSTISGESKRKRPTDENPVGEVRGEADVSGSVGSNEDAEFVADDHFRDLDSRATGFVGPNSEVRWLKRIKTIDKDEVFGDHNHGPPGAGSEATNKRIQARENRSGEIEADKIIHVADSTFYLDDQPFDMDIAVDASFLPPWHVAQKLFDCYMGTIHTSFPIVPKEFEKHFHHYINSIKRKQPVSTSDKWLAMLNLVYALGAQYSYVIQAPWSKVAGDHVDYMLRAVKLLGLQNTVTAISDPDLPMIQTLGLLSLYYLVIGRVSRAWLTLGLPLRSSLAFGMHLRNGDASASQDKQASLVRLWWSLRSLECLLCTITGRPYVIANEDCSVPRPMGIPEEKPDFYPPGPSAPSPSYPTTLIPSSESSSSKLPSLNADPRSLLVAPYFRALVDVNSITQDVFSALYSPRVSVLSWETVEGLIPSFLDNLKHWAATALIDDIDVTAPLFRQALRNPATADTRILREQLLLRFCYSSTKILITRPCLCRLDLRIQKQSAASLKFDLSMVGICVQAARDMAALLPDSPDPGYIDTFGPYWSIVHLLMQAMAVLLLEAMYGNLHKSRVAKDEGILKPIIKLLSWLGAMRPRNPVATRAYNIVFGLLKTGRLSNEPEIKTAIADAEKADEAARASPQLYGDPTEQQQQDQQWQDQYGDMNYAAEILQNFGTQNEVAQDFPLPDLYTDSMLWSGPDLQLPASYGNPFRTVWDEAYPGMEDLDDVWAPWLSLPFSPPDLPPATGPTQD